MPFAAGTRLGSYEVLSALGSGGMGEVYRARDAKLNRDVALKVLPDAFTADPERIARFKREAHVLASLNHPNIAAIYGFEESDPSTGSGQAVRALVLELVEGPTLADRIADGRLPMDEALPIAKQIVEALEAAHELGIVHRDLKPANIKLRPDGTVKVLDFGLAKAIEPASGVSAGVTLSPTITTPAMTQLGVILGTAAYMSPEQAKGHAADKRSDIWAFGCVLYEMLTGKRAFDGDDSTEVIAAVVRAEPDWSALPADVPDHLRLLLRRCLEKDRGKRVSGISAVRFLISEPVGSFAPAAHIASAVATSRTRWRNAASLGVAIIVFGILTAAALWRKQPAADHPVLRFSFPLGEGLRFTNLNRHVHAISPDGRLIAFLVGQQLHMRELASQDSRVIASETGGTTFTAMSNPVFSPDSRFVAFYSASDRALKRIPVSGGSPTTLCEAENPFGMSWDETGIVFGQGSKGIFRVSPNGGQPEVIVRVGTDEYVDGPQMLPGGHTILFTVTRGTALDRWERAQVVVQPLATGERKVVVDRGSDARYVPTGHLVYARGGVLFAMAFDLRRLQTSGGSISIIEGVGRPMTGSGQGNPLLAGTAQFSVSSAGTLTYIPGPIASQLQQTDLAWVTPDGAVERLKLARGLYSHVRVSPDGHRLVFANDNGNESNVYVHAPGTGTSVQRLTFRGNNRFPIWSGDGKRIAFQSDREGDRGIFWQAADGTGVAERLTRAESDTLHVPESLSPAGDVLLYTVTKGGAVTLWTFSIRDGKSTRFDDVSSSFPIGATYSADGHWVAYAANSAVYVQPNPPTGPKYQVPYQGPGSGPHHPFWSRDGKELFYEPTMLQLYAIPVRTQPEFAFGNPVALPAGAFGSTNPIFSRNRDIDLDGKRFITYVSTDETENRVLSTEIRVVLNWFEELKARVPAQ